MRVGLNHPMIGPLVLASLLGCRGEAKPAPAIDPPEASAIPLSVGTYSGGALLKDASFVRREYTRGKVRISVTIARYETNDEQYNSWVQASASYAAATLPVSADQGSGFYDCSGDGAKQICDLHIQLRPSFHIEVMGNGTATRPDLEELLHGLPLGTLVR